MAVTVSYDDKSGKSENDTKENENKKKEEKNTIPVNMTRRVGESKNPESGHPEGSVALSAEEIEAIWFDDEKEPWIEAKKRGEWISRDPQEEDCVATCVEFTWISGTDTDTWHYFLSKIIPPMRSHYNSNEVLLREYGESMCNVLRKLRITLLSGWLYVVFERTCWSMA